MTQKPAPDALAVAELARRLASAIAIADAGAADVAAVAGGEVSDDGAPLPAHAHADVPGVQSVTVTRRWEGDVPNAAEIRLAPGLSLADLEARLGSSRAMTMRKPGDDRVVFEDGAQDATLMATLDRGGDVRSVTVRRDV